ncbi:hypothetical protein AGDE_14859 [Angomonas deanei]|uniref:Zinc finger C-x8-C-x5-C-x3-H type (And similar), putative n=1 Tax=Angomonas deanei TaxID=59799 RepID=A0A7G2C3L6_9TRYP|nr:hypothetical protein AGDE_14859 [Angomonas deanei]CAD2214115.1 Zinc finger C-x8-C-x5-C-x3-H type (and similar), putative [Angomonas deanei]|eukprot:EPY20100.1 hypothetical protein AGDE_14859 [Angomonas deanei]
MIQANDNILSQDISNERPTDRKSPNGRPSTYYERTTTVRFVMPSTGRAHCTKLNRVIPTKAEVRSGALLCKHFLDGRCNSGPNCRFIHVPPSFLWKYLIPVTNREFYERGFSLRCFSPDMTCYYDIPSEYIYATNGSCKYIDLYNLNGDNFKEKFKICKNLQQNYRCDLGAQCEDIHCCTHDLSSFQQIHTHVANERAMSLYEKLPGDITVRVYTAHTDNQVVEDFNGSDVLRTAGATQYEEAYREQRGIPNLKMQHCVHFQNNKMCRLGDGCRFIHVVSVALKGNASPVSFAHNSSNYTSLPGSVVPEPLPTSSQVSPAMVQLSPSIKRLSPVRRNDPYSLLV